MDSFSARTPPLAGCEEHTLGRHEYINVFMWEGTKSGGPTRSRAAAAALSPEPGGAGERTLVVAPPRPPVPFERKASSSTRSASMCSGPAHTEVAGRGDRSTLVQRRS